MGFTIPYVGIGGGSLKQHISSKARKDLQVKMAKVLRQNIRTLSIEMQRILVDDMVTAFENRTRVLTRIQQPAVQISDTVELVVKQVKLA
jgi:hypothetical protein